MKKFEVFTTLTWSTGESFEAHIVDGRRGYGCVYDVVTGLYCGSLNPIRMIQLKREAGYSLRLEME